MLVKNTSKKPIKLTGYSIRDSAGHVYRFPNGFVLKAGKTVTVHTGNGTRTAGQLHWGQRWYIWNNDKDAAKLQKSGKTLSSFAYKKVNSTGFAVRG